MLGMIFDQAKVDIPRKSLSFILIGTFFDRFGAKMLVIYDEDDSAKSLHGEHFILNCDPNLVADEACWHCYG